MSSLKQRNKNHSERGSHTGQDDVAKKSTKSSKGGAGSGSATGRVLLQFLLFFILAAAAALLAWYAHSLSQQLSHLHRRSEETSLRGHELAAKLGTVLQQVESTKTSLGRLDSFLLDTQQQLQETNAAVRKGESKTHHIGETLQKLQTEILRDLSEGIQDVRDARERDVASLEKTVEEKLRELTQSIHDNIATFTEAQEKSESSVEEVKSRVGALAATVQAKHQEMATLSGEWGELKSSCRSQLGAQAALEQRLSRAEVSLNAVSKEVHDCRQDLQEARARLDEQGDMLSAESTDASAAAERLRESLDSRLAATEANVNDLNAATTHLSEKLEFYQLDSVQSALRGTAESQASLREDIQALKANLSELASPGGGGGRLEVLQRELQSLGARHKQQAEEARSKHEDSFTQLQKSVHEMGEKHRDAAAALKAMEEALQAGMDEKFSTVEASVDELRSSIGEAKSDLEALGLTVDSLLSKPAETEAAEDELASLKLSLNELQSDVDKLSVSLNRMQ
ncbi:LOW QUALITY PROTEIN: cytoskeleton-associated protein 4-like [Scyliorhinus canicula]|uniref:LOW QUALITY PROTEIN: cytoskeleton-associated protein 4-like n=1 Tax=Scyliorhinus canicula TaxID=7830 RepID=UPI0018F30814|nr:LOW QUALITY PROTEIN: cytoskeleton-associated protein 4-like [Scyliorhinus canicula]